MTDWDHIRDRIGYALTGVESYEHKKERKKMTDERDWQAMNNPPVPFVPLEAVLEGQSGPLFTDRQVALLAAAIRPSTSGVIATAERYLQWLKEHERNDSTASMTILRKNRQYAGRGKNWTDRRRSSND